MGPVLARSALLLPRRQQTDQKRLPRPRLMPRSREEPEAQDAVDRGRREACAPTCGSPTPTVLRASRRGRVVAELADAQWPSAHAMPAPPWPRLPVAWRAGCSTAPSGRSFSTPRNVTAASSDENGGGSAGQPADPAHPQAARGDSNPPPTSCLSPAPPGPPSPPRRMRRRPGERKPPFGYEAPGRGTTAPDDASLARYGCAGTWSPRS